MSEAGTGSPPHAVTAGLVTVVIPAYNSERTLEATLDSAIRQDYPAVEVVVADDGSSDRSREIVHEAASRHANVRCVSLQHSGLPAVARNAALREARGEFVAFLDSDDLWSERKLSRQVGILRQRPEVLGVCTQIQLIGNGGEVRPTAAGDLLLSLADILRANPIANSSMLLRTSAVRSIGPMNEDPRLRAIEDYEYWLRVLRQQDSAIYLICEPLTLYRMHAGSLSQQAAGGEAKMRIARLSNLRHLFRGLDGDGFAGRRKELDREIRRARSEQARDAVMRRLRRPYRTLLGRR